MSLSDQERALGFFVNMRYILGELQKIKDKLDTLTELHNRQESRRIVDSWVGLANSLAGMCFADMNTSGTYWVLGEPRGGYSSLFRDQYQLGRQDEVGEETYEEMNLALFFDHFDSSDVEVRISYNTLRIQIIVWNIIEAFNSLLYYVFRYEDEVFSSRVKAQLYIFIGDIINNRYNFTRNKGKGEIIKLEQIVLCRYRVFQDMYYRALRTAVVDTRVDQAVIVDQVKKMTLAEVEEYLDKLEYEARNQEVSLPKPGICADVLTGPIPPQAELEKVLAETKDKTTYEKAAKELEAYYSTCVGPFEATSPKETEVQSNVTNP